MDFGAFILTTLIALAFLFSLASFATTYRGGLPRVA
jgi:hypothetical protein